MNNDITHIFGYGLLMCKQSIRKIGALKIIARGVTLRGYSRVFNAPGNTYRYLNITEDANNYITGAIIAVKAHDLPILKEKETGYDFVDVSARIGGFRGQVRAFIAPYIQQEHDVIALSYITTCLNGVIPEDRKEWLVQSTIDYPIYDDVGVVPMDATGQLTNHVATYILIKKLGYTIV